MRNAYANGVDDADEHGGPIDAPLAQEARREVNNFYFVAPSGRNGAHDGRVAHVCAELAVYCVLCVVGCVRKVFSCGER